MEKKSYLILIPVTFVVPNTMQQVAAVSEAFENFQLRTYGIKAQVHATPEKKKRRTWGFHCLYLPAFYLENETKWYICHTTKQVQFEYHTTGEIIYVVPFCQLMWGLLFSSPPPKLTEISQDFSLFLLSFLFLPFSSMSMVSSNPVSHLTTSLLQISKNSFSHEEND